MEELLPVPALRGSACARISSELGTEARSQGCGHSAGAKPAPLTRPRITILLTVLLSLLLRAAETLTAALAEAAPSMERARRAPNRLPPLPRLPNSVRKGIQLSTTLLHTHTNTNSSQSSATRVERPSVSVIGPPSPAVQQQRPGPRWRHSLAAPSSSATTTAPPSPPCAAYAAWL